MQLFYILGLILLSASTVHLQSSEECDELGKRVSANIKQMEEQAGKGKLILPQDCNFAKNSVSLTRKYSRCLPQHTEGPMSRVYRNMRQVAKVVCENVNKRVMPCFSPENMRQFTQCTNRTLQYMNYAQKQNHKQKEAPSTSLSNDSGSDESLTATNVDSSDDSLNKEIVPATSGRTVSRRKKPTKGQDTTSTVAKKGPVSNQEDNSNLSESNEEDLGLVTTNTGNSRRSVRTRRGTDEELSEYEHSCCMLHLNSDCFLSKVVHHCADSTQLRTVRLLQTMFNFVVRDFVDVVCGRIESLEQCKKYSASLDEDDLGF